MKSDEELLAAFVAGDIDASHPALAALARRDPGALAEARELVRLRLALDADARLEREVLAEARESVSAADRARVRAAAEDAQQARRRRRGWRILPALIAVAAALLLVVRLLERPQPARDSRELLGGESTLALELSDAPEALVPDVALAWSGVALAGSERWVVEVRAAGSDRILLRPRCNRDSWTPTAADLSTLPEQVELSIVKVAADEGSREVARSRWFSLSVSR